MPIKLLHHQALEVARLGELRIVAGVGMDLPAHQILQENAGRLQPGKLPGIAQSFADGSG
ncbi:hypothetical protein ASD02_07490 [Ensifer sp. Root1252]|nr:hypothetical protein ASD00_06865 [Ensifer sp. Root31]KQW58802.1 hypothetical protein ASD02_07490 [Ensifer sp. Root1252]KQW74508.1 hypothetical protein ASD03_08130 [Ensifer sp. Root127]KQY62084.1 hypothetical protein ASD52_15740 [Ensifer sp. Root142]KRC67639.1 hypothetical protein ASE32_10950 [Ensifer sp. Root231]KRC98715.1 hypothetical protein ASE47_06140 [Ensifer sp. Root258]OMQ46233.1 hypothetical protein BKP54_04280 [Ensifer sp. 1H6]